MRILRFSWVSAFAMGFFLASLAPMVAQNKAFYLNEEQNTIEVFQRASASVVNIANLREASLGFFRDETEEVAVGTGSGIVWDDKGHIVTNYHVIQDASRLTVSFKDGITLGAKVIGAEPRKDVAVLKLEGKHSLKPIAIGSSSDLQVGQKTIAIGSPFGLDQSLTEGIVSALGRSILGIGGVTIRDMIQTDAAINPGNSGGPLLNSRGQLIAMNTMIYSKTGSSAGIGFAVPVDTIKRVVDQLIKYGRVKQSGIGIIRWDDSITRQLGANGVLIRQVVKGSGADKAGLRGTSRNQLGQVQWGDLIIQVGPQKIKNYDDFYNALETLKAGDPVELMIIRDQKKLKISVTLSEIQPN